MIVAVWLGMAAHLRVSMPAGSIAGKRFATSDWLLGKTSTYGGSEACGLA